jgi:hypothetical protein
MFGEFLGCKDVPEQMIRVMAAQTALFKDPQIVTLMPGKCLVTWNRGSEGWRLPAADLRMLLARSVVAG